MLAIRPLAPFAERRIPAAALCEQPRRPARSWRFYATPKRRSDKWRRHQTSDP